MSGYRIIMSNFYSAALDVFTYDQQISKALRAIGESGRILHACILYILLMNKSKYKSDCCTFIY